MLPVVGFRNPLWPKYHTIWFKTYILKDICPFKLLLGKKERKKLTFHHFRYTYIHKTNTCKFFFAPFPKGKSIIVSNGDAEQNKSKNWILGNKMHGKEILVKGER